MDKRAIQQIPILSLAYLGDAVWEIVVRDHLVRKSRLQANQLHQQATHYVKAAGQARIMQEWLDRPNWLKAEELTIFKRGRNAKSHTSAKNASIADYRLATGFEALFAYLYLGDEPKRYQELSESALAIIEEDLHV